MKIIKKDGTPVKNASTETPEYRLAVACYKDDRKEVEAILKSNPGVYINTYVAHIPTRGNGTPLILTGDVEIAKLLVRHGADAHHAAPASSDLSIKITPLDSAKKELTKLHVREDKRATDRIQKLVDYLESLLK